MNEEELMFRAPGSNAPSGGGVVHSCGTGDQVREHGVRRARPASQWLQLRTELILSSVRRVCSPVTGSIQFT